MVSIIIPNFNGIVHLEDCLNSLRRQLYKYHSIILVDNGSTDNSVNYVKENYPEVEIISLENNLGFAGAVNIGIRFAVENLAPEYIILLNNDVECDKYFVQELIRGFQSPQTGSVACKMLNYFERNKIDDAGNFIRLNKMPYARGQGELDSGQYDQEEFIFGACAGAAMYKSEALKRVGLFDEDFISYFEDVDLSFRLQHYGYKCLYNPRAVCYHKRGATTLSNIANCRYLIEKNIISLRIKNYPLKVLLKYSFIYLLTDYLRCIKDIYWFSFKVAFFALKGNLRGVLEIPKSLIKRKRIMRNSAVSTEYIINICKPVNS